MMLSVIKRSINDIFSLDVIIFVLKSAFIAALFPLLFIYLFQDGLDSFIHAYLSWIPSSWLQDSGAGVITWSIAYTLFILVIFIYTLKNSETLLIKLAKKHYPHMEVLHSPHFTISLFITFKSLMIFFMTLMFFMPFLPIPILGQGLMLYLTALLMKKPIYKIGTLFIADKKRLKEKNKNSTGIALLAVVFNYIPIANIFAPMFRQILFLHHVLESE